MSGSQRPINGADSEVTLEPDWLRTCEWFARSLADHSFLQYNTMPVASFMEQVRYLTQTDPVALQVLINKLASKY